MSKLILKEKRSTVTVVIPTSRVPESSMLNFWKELSTFHYVGNLIFVVNGQQKQTILDILSASFCKVRNVELISSDLASAPHARNIGLENVTTPFVHFLDDDDKILSDFYVHTVPKMEGNEKVGVAVSAYVLIDGSSDDQYSVRRKNRIVGLPTLLIDNALGVTSGVVLRTSAVKAVGGFNEVMPARQDYDLWLRLSKLGDFETISKPLLCWTEHRASPSIRMSGSIERHVSAIEKLIKLKETMGLEELPLGQRRRVVANHYKYLAVMFRLSTGNTPWGYILRSIVAYPQAKVFLMLTPRRVILAVRKAMSRIYLKRQKTASYGKTERNLARVLAKFPRTKKILKYTYQLIFYVLHSFKRVGLIIRNGTIEQITVPGYEEAETFFGYYDRIPENCKKQLIVHVVVSGKCSIIILDVDGTLLASIPTAAWNYQQGALSCWVDDETVAFNDTKNGCLVTGIYNVRDCSFQYFNGSFQASAAKGKYFASININLINNLRPEYGFNGVDPLFQTDEQLLAFRSIEDPDCVILYVTVEKMSEVTGVLLPVGMTKVNHVVFSPDGTRVTFLLRYFKDKIKKTHQIIYDFLTDNYCVVESGATVSHYCWLNNESIAIWGENPSGFCSYFLADVDGHSKIISTAGYGFSAGDGHPAPIPDTDYLISDTYPDKSGMSHLYMFSWKDGSEKLIGSFFQPFRFRGSKRIDLHPRYSHKSSSVYFDSGHSGKRGAYKITNLKNGI